MALPKLRAALADSVFPGESSYEEDFLMVSSLLQYEGERLPKGEFRAQGNFR